MNDGSDPDPAPVLELLEAFRRSKVMFAAVALGVFDRLAAGPATVAELARNLRLHAEALERLLDTCVGLQLLTREGAVYANTPTATAYLCHGSRQQMTGYINFSNHMLWKLWGHLEDAVREGSNRWQQAFGWEGSIFAHIFRTEEARREFLLGMHGYGQISSPEVIAAFDLSRFRLLVDLGGATGHLAIAACQRYPALRAIVFDLPEVVALAREMIGASPVAGRIEVMAGDFFKDPLPEADLFAVGRILHDWSEDKIHLLLERIYECLPSKGALLVAEKLLDEDKKGPRWAQLQSLNMLVCAEGKERTLSEYKKLLQAAAFLHIQGRRTNSPLDAILALKE